MTCGLTRSPIITIKISQLNETWKLGTRHATSLLKYLPFAIPYIQASILSIFISFCCLFSDILFCTCALQDVDLHCVWLCVGRFAGVVASIGGDRSAGSSIRHSENIVTVYHDNTCTSAAQSCAVASLSRLLFLLLSTWRKK